MKCLVLASVVCALAAVLDAACYRRPMKQGMTRCQDDVDYTWHDVESTWRNSACMDCSCDGCCMAYSIPQVFPDDCVSEFDAQTCKYKVHKKNDPSIECPIYGGVGK